MRADRGMRWATFIVFAGGLALSGLLTLLFWPYGLFVFLPFLFFPFRMTGARERPRTCDACGWSTRDPGARFCPRDGRPLPPPSRP